MDPITIALMASQGAQMMRGSKAGIRSRVGLPEPSEPGLSNFTKLAGIYGLGKEYAPGKSSLPEISTPTPPNTDILTQMDQFGIEWPD